MIDPKNTEEFLVEVEFPYPKLVKLFDFYFPKTKGYKKIDWRKILRVWSRWAPWVTILEMILLLWLVIPTEKGVWVHVIAFWGLVISLVNFIYYLVLAAFAKCIKRSPQVLLALTPRLPSWFLILALIAQLGTWFMNDESDHQKRLAQENARHPTSANIHRETQTVKP